MIKLKSLLLEKTLYHGTTKVAAKEIEKYGICPMTGDFVKNSYGCDYDEEDLKELVFATDKEQLGKAVGAITAQVAALLNKQFHDVTDQEFINRGAIIKIYDGEGLFQRRDKEKDGFYDEHPSTVEPGDYYSEKSIGADEILTGNAMLRLLKRYGEWPRDFGKDEKKNRRELLIRMAVKYHKDIPKNAIVNYIKNLPNADIDRYFYKYKSVVKEIMDSPPPAVHQQSTDAVASQFSNDFIDYIKAIENAQRVGYDKYKKLWFPHKSVEGGMPTIGYGHKIKNNNELKIYNKGISDTDVPKLLSNDLLIADKQVRGYIKRKYNVNLSLSKKQSEILVDYAFNLGGLDKFPKFVDAVLRNQWDIARKEYIRKSNGKELTDRNRTFYNRYLR